MFIHEDLNTRFQHNHRLSLDLGNFVMKDLKHSRLFRSRVLDHCLGRGSAVHLEPDPAQVKAVQGPRAQSQPVVGGGEHHGAPRTLSWLAEVGQEHGWCELALCLSCGLQGHTQGHYWFRLIYEEKGIFFFSISNV